MRLDKNGIRYFSFAELPFSTKQKKKKNTDELRKRFEERHTCVVCGETLTWIPGTNICSCKNPDCKGKKYVYKDEDGTEFVEFRPYYHMLDVVGTSIAEKIYGDQKIL